jgi:hypothetical protein
MKKSMVVGHPCFFCFEKFIRICKANNVCFAKLVFPEKLKHDTIGSFPLKLLK